MRWFMIGFFLSLLGLLLAVGGAVRHVRRHHKKLRQQPSVDTGSFPAPVPVERPQSRH